MYREYVKARRQRIRELLEEKFRKQQQRSLLELIAETFREIREPKKQFWIEWMVNSYSKRFYNLTKCDWIQFLSQMNDNQAYGKYTYPKTRKYCLMIRDRAVRKVYGEVNDDMPERA